MPKATAAGPNAIDQCADAWAALGRFSTSGIGGPMGCAIRFSIVCKYVRGYLREHGRFPSGSHQVHGTYGGKAVMRFETRFPSRALAALAAHGHRFDPKDVWGLPSSAIKGAFGQARKKYEVSPARPRLRAWLLVQIEEALRDPMPGAPGEPSGGAA